MFNLNVSIYTSTLFIVGRMQKANVGMHRHTDRYNVYISHVRFLNNLLRHIWTV